MIDLMNSKKICNTSLAPEGSRKFVAKWKTGWYFIAKNTGAVIVPIGLDYSTKTLHIHKVIEPTDKYEHDLIKMQEELKQYTPMNPDKCNLFQKNE